MKEVIQYESQVSLLTVPRIKESHLPVVGPVGLE